MQRYEDLYSYHDLNLNTVKKFIGVYFFRCYTNTSTVSQPTQEISSYQESIVVSQEVRVESRVLTSVYIILHGNVTTKFVNLDLEMGRIILCYLFGSSRLCGSALKWALETW